MCMVQQRGFKFVSIVTKGESRGCVRLTPIQLYDKRRGKVYREKAEREILIELAGPVAEKIAREQHEWKGTGSDVLSAHRAIELASQMYDEHDTIRAYLKYLWFETRDILVKPEHWKAVQILAAELIDNRRVSGPRAREFFRRTVERDAKPTP